MRNLRALEILIYENGKTSLTILEESRGGNTYGPPGGEKSLTEIHIFDLTTHHPESKILMGQ